MASLFIKKHPNKKTWSLGEQSYRDKKSIQKTIPKSVYQSLGFDENWSIERAKERVQELNKMNSLEREKQRAVVSATKRVHRSESVVSIFLPQKDVDHFTNLIEATNMGSQKHLEKRLMMWEAVKKLIQEIELEPKYYFEYSKVIFKYFAKKRYSLDYSKKLLGIMNRWGSYIAVRDNFHFRPIPSPVGKERDVILKAYRESDRCRENGSAELSIKELKILKNKLKPEYYEFMFISLWLGLRPDEIELAQFTTYFHEKHNLQVLRIYQPKVANYKHIPILYPEQKLALSYLRPLKRPLNKTLQRHLGNKRITVYSGRKGFEKLMTELGEALTDISKWLGHSSIRTTEQHYESKDKLVLSRRGVVK